jgi:undecaprenyl-diphosphatase
VTGRAGLRALSALAVAALVGFVALSLDVTHHGLLERHDLRVGLWIGHHTPATLERVASAITQLGGAWSLVALAAGGASLLLRRGRRADAVLLVGGLATVSLVTNGLKIAFGRPRPASDLSPILHTASFPSGHTSGSMVVFVLLAVFLATRHRHAAIGGAVLLAGLVGATRVVVGAHWTTDVLAGYCLGGVVVAGALIVRDLLLELESK